MSNEKVADSKTRYFVRIYEDDQYSYDVGPFESLDGSFSESIGAMEWLYQQIGLLKTHHPEEKLVKEIWNYQKESGSAQDRTVDIKVRFSKYSFQVFTLHPPRYSKVVKELITEDDLPDCAKESE